MTTETPKEKPDLSEIFDLKRHKAVTAFVARFEQLLRDRDGVNADILQLKDEAKQAAFTPIEVGAMYDIAKWRNGDKIVGAAIKLAALRRVSNAVKLDLFSWADQHKDDAA